MDKSWMGTNRTNKSYVDGVAAFIDYAVHNLQKIGNIDIQVYKQRLLMPCLCTKCLNYIEHKVEEVQFYLFRNRIDLSYTNWTRHGEKDEPSISAPKPVNAKTEFVDDINFASDIPTDGPTTVEMVNATKDNFDEDDLVKFQELLLDAEKPLYEGYHDFTKLSAIVKLLNLKGGFKGCVVCGKDTNCVRLSASSKQIMLVTNDAYYITIRSESKKKAFNGQQESLPAPILMTREQIYNEIKHIENKWGKGKRTNNKASENQEDTRGRGRKIQKQKRNTTEEEGNSSQVNGQNGAYWKKFNIWYRKLTYWRHNSVPYCIDFMHVEKNVVESLVRTLLHVSRKTKDGVNARLDLAELGVKPELFSIHCFKRHKQVLKTKNSDKRIAFLKNKHSKSFAKWLHKEVERELAISKESASETVRWISYGPRATVVKYDAYNINGYTFRTNVMMAKFTRTMGAGGVKRDTLGYTLVDLNNLGHKTPPKNYKDTYDEVDEEFSTVIYQRNDNISPCVNQRDLGNESRDDYYRTDCGVEVTAAMLD
nr:hypothetical protein [Tanacetum cinerariifolium]